MSLRAFLFLAMISLTGTSLVACHGSGPDSPDSDNVALTVQLLGSGSGSVTDGALIACETGLTSGCAADYNKDTSVTLTATAQPGSVFVSWGGACAGSDATCVVTMDQAKSVTAQFNVVQDTLQIVISGTGTGTVTSVPAGINCGNYSGAPNLCSQSVPELNSVTLTATPQSGSVFAGWTGDCTGTAATCAITMNGAKSVTAKFNQIQLTAPLVSSISQGDQAQGQVQALGLRYLISAQGIYPSPTGGMPGTGQPYLGQIILFAGAAAPAGWLPCDGSLLPISTNAALFSLIGTTYGGNGTTTFALPDLRAQVPMGAGALTTTPPASVAGTSLVPVISSISQALTAQGQVKARGINYYIALSGVYPSTGGSVSTSSFYLGQLMMFAGTFAPGGWALADGSLLPINTNTALFSLLGTQYGGNGTTNFALPDLRARAPMGVGSFTPGILPSSPYEVPLISSITLGGSAQGQAGVLGMNTLIATTGVYPSPSSGGSSIAYIGQIMHFAGNFAPGGWAPVNGATVSISSNTALFSILGTMYGGDGSSTFSLPDLRARVPMGSN